MVDAIFHRTSVRSFLDKDVEDEKIEMILKSAMAAPSAGNQQPWEFFVVKNKTVLEKLATTSPYAKCVANAPMAFVVCYKSQVIYPEYCQIDAAIATQNMLLAIDDLGLGAVWLGVAPIKERMEAVNKALDINGDLTAFAIVPFGYPEKNNISKERYNSDLIHYLL